MPRGRRKGEVRAVPEPGWIGPFLEALEQSGNVRQSAAAAGIDVTGVYNRRARHAEFREAWLQVLCAREDRARGGAGVALERPEPDAPPAPASPAAALPLDGQGAELTLVPRTSGSRMARRGSGRWGMRAEQRFLAELAATANVKRAAAAAGFSAEAVYKRRLKTAAFAAAWDAAIEVGKARLKAMLVEAAGRTFDPDSLPLSEGGYTGNVSVSEALHIIRLKGNEGGGGTGDPRNATREWPDRTEEVAEARERLARKLQRVLEKTTKEKLDQGWSLFEDHLIPPGWVRAEPVEP